MEPVSFVLTLIVHGIWASVILHALDEILEQRRRETKTGEFED